MLDKTLTSKDGRYQILVSEIYNGPLTGGVSSGNSLEALKTKISKESGDCMIDEDGNIIPEDIWFYKITGEDTCELVYETPSSTGGSPRYDCAYNMYYGGLDNGNLEYNIPVYIKVENKVYKVTSLGNGFLNRLSSLSSVTIPNSVINIGENAFYGCSGLSSVTIPDSVRTIGKEAFYGCYYGGTVIYVSDRVETIGEDAFAYLHIYYNGTASGSPWGASQIN